MTQHNKHTKKQDKNESDLKHYLPSFTSLTTDQDSLLEKLLSSRIRVSQQLAFAKLFLLALTLANLLSYHISDY